MNTYKIKYRKDCGIGAQCVIADHLNGLSKSSDSYVFLIDSQVVAIMPKSVVVSITKIPNESEDMA